MLTDEIEKMERALAGIEEGNEIHRKAAQGVKDWEDIFRSIDNELPSTVFVQENLKKQGRNFKQRLKKLATRWKKS